MARRTKRVLLSEDWKRKISTAKILARVEKCAEGEIEMTPTQLKACEILLRKTIPDLKQVDFDGELRGEFTITKIVREYVHAENQDSQSL